MSGIKRSPKKTIESYCLQCTGGEKKEVFSCNATDAKFQECPFHSYRLGQKRASVKIMRLFCLQCMGGSKSLVRDCETSDCLIHPYRTGKNLSRAGIGQSGFGMALIMPQNIP